MYRRNLLILIAILIVSLAASIIISAEETEYEVTKLEAEDNVGRFAVGESDEASGGKYIGIDYTLDTEGFYNYAIIYENVPETTTVSFNYASPHGGEVIFYLEVEEGKQEVIGAMIYDATGGWDPFGDTLGIVEEQIYIPEGSKVTIVTTSTFNVDYFEFKFNESEKPKPTDGKQKEGVKDLNNVFLSDLEFLRATRVVLDTTYMFTDLSINGEVYSKGLCMSAGHFPGSEFVEINIEGLGFTTFASYIGVDDVTNTNYSAGMDTTVKFYVEVDGVVKYESDVMTIAEDPRLVVVDVTDAKVLKLYTSPVDDGVGTDICVWGNAALGKTSNIEEIFATPVPTESPTPNPTTESTPGKTDDKTGSGNDEETSGYIVWIIIAAIVVIAAVVIFVIVKKKK
ncbi:MAG TPA: hypothetical protein GXZ66_03280 [Clostridiaceae bacterium]|jgi:hypothetical protein|nr:hypothetical protein [Clostridiaceae bacterium]HOA30976.1 NPCBM/NEW2 domain-containing protein [Clostridia bacterium]